MMMKKKNKNKNGKEEVDKAREKNELILKFYT